MNGKKILAVCGFHLCGTIFLPASALAVDPGQVCPITKEEMVLKDSDKLETFQRALAPEGKPAVSLGDAVKSGNLVQVREALLPVVLEMLSNNVRLAPDSRIHPFIKKMPGSDGWSFPYTVPSSKTYGTASWLHDLVYGAFQCDRVAKFVRNENPELARALDQLLVGSVSATVQNQLGEGPNRGMIGHMNHLHEKSFINTFGHEYTSNISQPPVLATIIERLQNSRLNDAMVDSLMENARWWRRERMEGNLVFTPSPWELGTDALNSVDVSLLPRWGLKQSELLKNETKNSGVKDQVSKNARFNLAEAILKAGGVNAPGRELKQLMDHKSTAMNAYVIMSLQSTANILRTIASEGHPRRTELLEEAANIERDITAIKDQVNRQMWNENDGFYYSKAEKPEASAVEELVKKGVDRRLLEVKDNGQVPIKVLGAFISLAAEVPSLRQAERMLDVFDREFRTKFLAPTVSKDAPGFVPNSYWRGSTWINENYWVAIGFMKYARKAEAAGNFELAARFYQASKDICESSIKVVESGLYEYYSSADGKPEGPDQFTWSGLAFNMTFTLQEAGQGLDAVNTRLRP